MRQPVENPMEQSQTKFVSRPQFRLERLQDRLLLSAVLDDGSEVVDEIFVEEVPVEEYVEFGDPSDVAFEDLMFYTMILPAEGLESELIDPMPEETGEEVYFGEVDGEVVMYCGFGELESEVEILVADDGSVVDDELIYATGAPAADEEVELVPATGPEAVAVTIAAADAISGDLLGSSDDLLGGSDSVL